MLLVCVVSAREQRDRRMRLTLTPERYAAWRAREDEAANRWKTCAHRYDRVRWAGILGWRVDCSKCFHHFIPDDHDGCTTCEAHPEPLYWNGYGQEEAT